MRQGKAMHINYKPLNIFEILDLGGEVEARLQSESPEVRAVLQVVRGEGRLNTIAGYTYHVSLARDVCNPADITAKTLQSAIYLRSLTHVKRILMAAPHLINQTCADSHDRRSPFMSAVFYFKNDYSILDFLLSMQADVNQCVSDRLDFKSPLSIAVIDGSHLGQDCVSLVSYLLAHGVRASAPVEWGYGPVRTGNVLEAWASRAIFQYYHTLRSQPARQLIQLLVPVMIREGISLTELLQTKAFFDSASTIIWPEEMADLAAYYQTGPCTALIPLRDSPAQLDLYVYTLMKSQQGFFVPQNETLEEKPLPLATPVNALAAKEEAEFDFVIVDPDEINYDHIEEHEEKGFRF
jgi:hypothetical protein